MTIFLQGFFLTVSLESVLKLGDIAVQQNKIYVTNLSAPFIASLYRDSLKKSLFYADIVFGNELEALAFAEGNLDTKNISEIAKKIANLPKGNKKRERIVVITQGSHPVLFVQGKKIF